MRVLWFTNSPCNYFGSQSKGASGGGWMVSIQEEIEKDGKNDLGICFLTSQSLEKKIKCRTTYFPIDYRKKSIIEKIKGYVSYNDVTVEEPEWSYYIEEYRKVITDFCPDIIHVWGSEQYAGLSAFATDIPLVLHIQGTLNPCYATLYPMGISRKDFIFKDYNLFGIIQRYYSDLWWRRHCYRERKILEKVNHFIGRTDWDQRTSAILSPGSKYHFGEEIMRTDFYNPRERCLPEKMVVTTVISSPIYKGYDIILKTAKILSSMHELQFEWNVYGIKGDSFIEKEIGIKPSEVNVICHGRVNVETIKKAHSQSTVYFHSSYIENGCNSIIEAQMSACPIIANYVGGLSNTVKNNETGYLVPLNDPYQAAYLIKYLYEHPDENIAMGRRAQQDAFARHDKKKIVTDLFMTYNEILNDV